MISGIGGFFPQIAEDVWIDPSARLIGNITSKGRFQHLARGGAAGRRWPDHHRKDGRPCSIFA